MRLGKVGIKNGEVVISLPVLEVLKLLALKSENKIDDAAVSLFGDAVKSLVFEKEIKVGDE